MRVQGTRILPVRLEASPVCPSSWNAAARGSVEVTLATSLGCKGNPQRF